MDVFGEYMSNGAIVHQWTCLGAGQSNQLWILKSVEAADIPTTTTVDVPLSMAGEPGYAESVTGHVDTGAYVGKAEKRYVNLLYQKEVSPGNWETKGEVHHPTLDSNGYFSWGTEALGPGSWRVRAAFQGDSDLHLAPSDAYDYFVINRGYRMVNRYSGKCLTLLSNKQSNAQPIVQWKCAPSATPGDGQVITFVPQGGGYYEILVNTGNGNGTGKCVDVEGSFTHNGAATHLWQCLGAGQANQLWDEIPIAGQNGFFAYKAKHSNRCADNRGPTMNDGGVIQQYDCNWKYGQQWSLQPVG
jgi:hypothetical protein